MTDRDARSDEPLPGDPAQAGGSYRSDLRYSQGSIVGGQGHTIHQSFHGRTRATRRRLLGDRRRGAAVLTAVAAAVVVIVVVVVYAVRGGGPALAAGPLSVSLSDGYGLIVAPDGRRAYISDSNQRAVQVVDLATRSAIGRLPAGAEAGSLAVSRDGTLLAVANRGFINQTQGSVTLLDLAHGGANITIPLPGRPGPILITPDERSVFVADRGNTDAPGRTLTKIDIATHRTRVTPVGAWPRGLAMSPDGRTVYVTCPKEPTREPGDGVIVAVPVDDGPPTTIPTPRPLYDLAATPDGLLYGTARENDPPGNGIDVVDPRARTIIPRTDPALNYPQSIDITPDGRYLAVEQTNARPPVNALSIVDTARGTVLTTTDVPPEVIGVAVTPDGRHALVASTHALTAVDIPT